ncbi:DUF1553 domain-containing protein [Novipirellula artificiosorum]|nr:DUF1553 domain-containing protein [Novipirellula artificiosorum]
MFGSSVVMFGLVVWVVAESGSEVSSPTTGSATAEKASPVAAVERDRRDRRLREDALVRPDVPASHSGQSLALDLPDTMHDLETFDTEWTDRPFESESPVHAHNSIDDLVFRNLIERGIEPAKLCSDETFLRRVYIDLLGTLPTVDETTRFLDDRDERKRAKLIDAVLQRDEYVDYITMKWCDILRVKAEFPINLWPNAAQAYHHWIHESVKTNRRYDEFAFELLTASGSNFRTPQVNFYRAMQSKEPIAIAQTVALTFLCERAEKWPTERLEGMSGFFSKVGYKPTGEWKEEIVFYDARRGETASPNDPVAAVYPNGVKAIIPAGEDPRRVFASWLVHEKNPWFARAIANRVWFWLLGRGIVDPPDDVGPENPASNLELLNHLADDLIAADFDLKHLFREILNSSTYQLSCIPATEDPDAGVHFAHYHPRRLDAEVLIDAICQITGTTEVYMSIIPEPFTFLPDHQRAIALPDGSITSSFLETFGRPARDTGMELERNNRLTAGQALHLLNSNHIRDKLKQGPGIKELLRQAINSTQTAEILYLAILSRRPTETERMTAEELCRSHEGTRDLAWALVNTDEFLFRH